MAFNINMIGKRTSHEIIKDIARAAYGLFSRRPPSAVTLREIAAAANVNLGLIHRYVGSKDDVISLVLAGVSAQGVALAAIQDDDTLVAAIAEEMIDRPATGRLIAGMVLDGVDIARLKDGVPLVERLARNNSKLDAAMIAAFNLGWEVFGDQLLINLNEQPDRETLLQAVQDAMRALQNRNQK